MIKSVDDNRTGADNPGTPGQIFQALMTSTMFRQALEARIDLHFGDAGLFQPSNAGPMYEALAEELEPHILLEIARWGDNRQDPSYSESEWRAERDWILDEYFPNRMAIVRQQLLALLNDY